MAVLMFLLRGQELQINILFYEIKYVLLIEKQMIGLTKIQYIYVFT